MKSRDGKGQRREEKKKEDQERESLRRKRIQEREKVGKSRNTVFFQWFVAPEGQKVGSLKRRVQSQLARWEMKSCTPLWREAHLRVKNLKTRYVRSTFWSWDVEKVHAVVARSTFQSQKCTKYLSFGALLEVEMSKRWTPLWREVDFDVKMLKPYMFGLHLEIETSKKRTPFWRETHFEVKKRKAIYMCAFFRRLDVVSRDRRKKLCTLLKRSKAWRFYSISKGNGRYTIFKKDLQRRRNIREMFIRAVRRSGYWFPERGCILEH